MTSHNPPPARLRDMPKGRPGVWFWKPQLYWFGWRTLVPAYLGHDEFSRETLVLGWTVTGRIIIPLRYCGDTDCYEQTLRWNDEENEPDGLY